jgi:putative transposase
MPSRLQRFQKDGHHHAINFSCFRHQPWLQSEHSCIIFEETLEELRKRHKFYVFGYVIMPDHVHLLLSEPHNQTLATTISVLKSETSKHLKGDRKQFWQVRYFDFNIFTQKKFVEKLRYIHRNPVEEGLVEKPEDWQWSSYRHWLTGESSRVEIESRRTFVARERAQTPPITIHPKEQTTAPRGPRMKP